MKNKTINPIFLMYHILSISKKKKKKKNEIKKKKKKTKVDFEKK